VLLVKLNLLTYCFNWRFSAITNVRQDTAFDGNSFRNDVQRSFNGGLYRYSRFNFYLGKNDIHADWYADADKYKEEISSEKKS
jgi:hypothetical protein